MVSSPVPLTDPTPRTYRIVVHTSAGTSTPVTFTTTPSPSGVPTIASISPTSAPVGSSPVITFTGSNFDPVNTIKFSWPGTPWRTMGQASSTQNGTVITLPPILLSNTTPTTYSLFVENHVGASNQVTFTSTAQ